VPEHSDWSAQLEQVLVAQVERAEPVVQVESGLEIEQ
jgi:hypothetical protein